MNSHVDDDYGRFGRRMRGLTGTQHSSCSTSPGSENALSLIDGHWPRTPYKGDTLYTKFGVRTAVAPIKSSMNQFWRTRRPVNL